jgi:hypothetical protein
VLLPHRLSCADDAEQVFMSGYVRLCEVVGRAEQAPRAAEAATLGAAVGAPTSLLPGPVPSAATAPMPVSALTGTLPRRDDGVLSPSAAIAADGPAAAAASMGTMARASFGACAPQLGSCGRGASASIGAALPVGAAHLPAWGIPLRRPAGEAEQPAALGERVTAAAPLAPAPSLTFKAVETACNATHLKPWACGSAYQVQPSHQNVPPFNAFVAGSSLERLWTATGVGQAGGSEALPFLEAAGGAVEAAAPFSTTSSPIIALAAANKQPASAGAGDAASIYTSPVASRANAAPISCDHHLPCTLPGTSHMTAAVAEDAISSWAAALLLNTPDEARVTTASANSGLNDAGQS